METFNFISSDKLTSMLIYVPPPFRDLQVPQGFEATIYDAQQDEVPGTAELVEFYVPAYMASKKVFEVITHMPKLRYLHLLTAGVDSALPYCRPGVTLINAKGVHDSSTAELALALALTSLRGLDDFIRAGNQMWDLRRSRPSLFDTDVAIVGAGSIGNEIARIFSALGAKTSLISRTGRHGSLPLSEADDLLGQADIVILIVPLTQDTYQLGDAKFFSLLKDGALLINVARGEVVDTQALLNELTTGRIRAALDVTDPEPLPQDHPLFKLPNCIITPHVGGATDSFFPKAKQLIEENLERIAIGLEPLNIVQGAY